MLNFMIWFIVVIGIISTVISFITKGVPAGIFSAIFIYPSVWCYQAMYGMIHIGGFPVFFLVTFLYLTASIVCAAITLTKEMIQYYAVFVSIVCLSLVTAL